MREVDAGVVWSEGDGEITALGWVSRDTYVPSQGSNGKEIQLSKPQYYFSGLQSHPTATLKGAASRGGSDVFKLSPTTEEQAVGRTRHPILIQYVDGL